MNIARRIASTVTVTVFALHSLRRNCAGECGRFGSLGPGTASCDVALACAIASASLAGVLSGEPANEGGSLLMGVPPR